MYFTVGQITGKHCLFIGNLYKLTQVHITLNDKEINLPMSIVIPIIYKLKVRKLFRRKKESLHLYVMLKQRKSCLIWKVQFMISNITKYVLIVPYSKQYVFFF